MDALRLAARAKVPLHRGRQCGINLNVSGPTLRIADLLLQVVFERVRVLDGGFLGLAETICNEFFQIRSEAALCVEI